MYYILLALALFLSMLFALEVGRRFGVRRIALDGEGATKGVGVVDGAVFGLLGLLIAFSFSGAHGRFDQRRQMIVQEANAIGTAYLRLDLLADDARVALRQDFRAYLDTRLEVYRLLPDLDAAFAMIGRAGAQQTEIWRRSIAACRRESAPYVCGLLLPALNEMFDIATTRTMASRNHPPPIVFVLLFGLAVASSVLAGYGMAGGRTRGWLHMVGFATAMSIAVYTILDIEFPRLGLIQVSDFDQALVQLRKSMN